MLYIDTDDKIGIVFSKFSVAIKEEGSSAFEIRITKILLIWDSKTFTVTGVKRVFMKLEIFGSI